MLDGKSQNRIKTDLKTAGLPKQVITALLEQGIDSVENLCSFSLDDLELLDGIGPKALLLIAKIKEGWAGSVTMPQAAQTTAESKAEAERQANLMKEPPPGEGTVTTKTFTVELQFRHAEWITRAAKAYSQTEEQIIQQAIRGAYQRDPYKAGDTAISGSVLKHDNPYRQADQN